MKNGILMLVVLVGIVFTPLLVSAHPSITELNDCSTNVKAFLNDLINISKNSPNVVDKYSALELIQVADLYKADIDYLRDLLFIVSIIKDDNDRNRVNYFLDLQMKDTARGIDHYTELANLAISHAQNDDIVSTGNKIKTELSKLQKLLSPLSKE